MIGFPLLLIPLAIYNIIAFLMRDVSFATPPPLFTVPLMTGADWQVNLSDVLLTLAILLLFCEVIKGARPGAKFLTDHLLSLLVFCGAAAEFVLLKEFGTSTFFLLTLLALVDFLSGIALRTRRRAQLGSSLRFRAGPRERPTRRRNPNSNPSLRQRRQGRLPSRWIAPNRKSGVRRRPRCRPRGCSRAMVRSRRRIRRADLPLHGLVLRFLGVALRQALRRVRTTPTHQGLDRLPGPDAGRPGGALGSRCRRSAHRRPWPAASCGFAGHDRRSRAIA